MGAPAGRHAHAHAPAAGHGHPTPDVDPHACRTHNDAEAYLDALAVGDLYALAAADHHEWCLRKPGPEGASGDAPGSGSAGDRRSGSLGGRARRRNAGLRPGGGVADLGAAREDQVRP